MNIRKFVGQTVEARIAPRESALTLSGTLVDISEVGISLEVVRNESRLGMAQRMPYQVQETYHIPWTAIVWVMRGLTCDLKDGTLRDTNPAVVRDTTTGDHLRRQGG